MQMFPNPPKPLDIWTVCKSQKGKPAPCTPGKQPHCLLLPLFFFSCTVWAGLGALRVLSLALKGPLQVKSLSRCFSINRHKPVETSGWAATS